MSLVDEDSLVLLKEAFERGAKWVIKTFRDFSNSLGSNILNVKTASYLIDQLLIKPTNRFDIYLLFSMVILLVNSEDHPAEVNYPPEEGTQKEPVDLRTLLEKARLIQLEPFAEVFVHIYDGSTLYHSPF